MSQDKSYEAVLARQNEIMNRALGIDYEDFERGGLAFDYEALMDQVGVPVEEAVKILADLGVERVLTTGQAATVEAGLPVIKKMVDYSRGRLEIMPGGGTPLNARQLVAESGCDQVHMAAFRTVYDTSTAARPSITYGFSLYPPEDRYELASQAVINDVRRALD